MRKVIIILFSTAILFAGMSKANAIRVQSKEKKEIVIGDTFELNDNDNYEISKAQGIDKSCNRFIVKGDISETSTKNGFISYAVTSDNLELLVDKSYDKDLLKPNKKKDWHIINDKSDTVDGIELPEDIGTGAIVVQTSKDGKTWITADYETDINNKLDSINNPTVNGEKKKSFYETTNVQLANGCYYRIIVAYRLQKELKPKKILLFKKRNTEEIEQMEVYQFYAFDPTVDQTEVMRKENAYEFGDVYRVDSQDGFEDPKPIESDDPHNDWSVGKFYVSGYTDYLMDGEVPVFLKVPGDKAALWFNLEQELDKCNGRTDTKINYISSGSDLYFGTPTIDNFGKGALIVRKTDKQNKKERQIYTNYLEASATVGSNTRVDLFEEGDYEAALDYQLHYDKPFIFGKTTTKTLSYRMFFKFKVRNGDISAFLRDIDTGQFISNADVVRNGFYIDVANSQYLKMTIKREVLTDSMDGLVEDTKFSGVAKEGREYKEEGIYTVTVKNLATGDSVCKKVYVGDQDVLKAHVATGLPISEINEKIANGAYVDEKGRIIDRRTEKVLNEVVTEDVKNLSEESQSESIEDTEKDNEQVDSRETSGQQAAEQEDDSLSKLPIIVFGAVVIAAIAAIVSFVKKKRK